ncbi:MAG: imelysin family protein [Actinomycetota bacterium]
MTTRWIAPLLGLAVLAGACGSDGDDRGDTLAALAEVEIVPAYEQFAVDAATLHAATETFCGAPGELTLGDAQAALITARASWKATEAMWVGPVMDRRSFAFIDWRTAPDQIESLLANEELAVDPDLVRNRIGSDQRGLGAAEYLLFGDDALDRLAQDDRRCTFAVSLTAVMDDEATGIIDAWKAGEGETPPFTEDFPVASGRHLDALVNDQLILLRKMVQAELGTALGLTELDTGADALVEGPAEVGRLDLETRLDGVRAVLIGSGREPAGLAPVLSDGLVERLQEALGAAGDAMSAVPPGPLRQTLVDDPDALAALRDALGTVREIVATEVVSELGVAVGFSDADGDSGG